jgi:hypothetical protein
LIQEAPQKNPKKLFAPIKRKPLFIFIKASGVNNMHSAKNIATDEGGRAVKTQFVSGEVEKKAGIAFFPECQEAVKCNLGIKNLYEIWMWMNNSAPFPLLPFSFHQYLPPFYAMEDFLPTLAFSPLFLLSFFPFLRKRTFLFTSHPFWP